MYDGYLCFDKDVFIEVPRWEHRDFLGKDISVAWLRLHNPYKYDMTTAIREAKRKLAKKNNPFDIIDCKAVIDILRQIKKLIDLDGRR